jgi:penicillin-binding protein 2
MRKWILILLLVTLSTAGLTSCRSGEVPPNESVQYEGDIDQALAVQTIAGQFLEAWRVEDYDAMFGMLSTLSRDAIGLADFKKTYQQVANTITLVSLDYRLISAMADKNDGQIAYRVDFHTLLVGDLAAETMMNLTREGTDWRIQWEIGMILPDLRGGNHLEFVHQIPDRGRIYDRDGAPLAAYEDAIAVGLVPGQLLAEQTAQIYATLAEIGPYTETELADMVERTPDDWLLPVKTLSREKLAPYIDSLREMSGVRLDEFRQRVYVEDGIGPHALGYMLYIPEDEVEDYIRRGYRQDERVGWAGLEAVYENELSGQRGGSLYLVGPDGEILSLVASSDSRPGQTVYTTLDKTLQARLQESLGDLRAAVVVMELDTGKVLALVSNPGFDPNAFDTETGDPNLVSAYFTDENQPLFNRATQGQYPLGSIFKIISMSTALETEIYTQYSSFVCGHTYWTCDSVYLEDWTLAHGTSASGELTLPEGLMRSCNPWFYRIGETLYNEGFESALSEMAMGFGLGAPTGIEIPEEAGNIPEMAANCLNNAQMAIGQGEILVTPIQVASFVAALANGGTLYRPALVERIKPASGEATYEFTPVENGTLPISAETREIVLEALRLVTEDSRGTGYWALLGLDIPVSGKTGTAQTPSGDAHAWFAGFTRQNDPERPDIAVVVLVENGGEGSAMAAPIFKRAVSLYFSDGEDSGGVMPWESEPYVPLTPTPTATDDSPSDG